MIVRVGFPKPSKRLTSAFLAVPMSAFVYKQIVTFKRVAKWTVRASGQLRSEILASHRVLSTGNRFQVSRIHAAAIATQMIQLFSLWNRTNKQLISYSVSNPRSTWSMSSMPVMAIEASIAGALFAGGPRPAGYWPTGLIYMTPESFFFRNSLGHRRNYMALISTAVV